MPGRKVSPRYTEDDLDAGRCSIIDIFEDQITACLLDFADRVLRYEHCGIAALALSGAVIQPVGAILSGLAPGDGNQFSCGFKRLFGESNQIVIDRFWQCVRCGILHEGFIKPGVEITTLSQPYIDNSGYVSVDPIRFVDALRTGFKKFIADLRKDDALQRHLQCYYAQQHQKAQKWHVTVMASSVNASPLLTPQPTIATATISPAASLSPFSGDEWYKPR